MRRPIVEGSLTVDEITLAESAIITAVQREAFPYEYSQSNKPESSGKIINTALQRLSPICVSRVLRVGGRLRRAPLDFDTKHPIILPSKSHITRLLIEQYHRDVGHCG